MINIGISINNSYASGFTPILDDFAKPQTAWFIPALLWSDYAGAAIRIRRASDDAETDINYVNGLLDEDAIATHCGASEGFIVTAYDQSGNSNNWTQATITRQPKIYNGSTVIKRGLHPALQADAGASQHYLQVSATGSATSTLFEIRYSDRNRMAAFSGSGGFCGYYYSVATTPCDSGAGASVAYYVNTQSVANDRSVMYAACNNNDVIVSTVNLNFTGWTSFATKYLVHDEESPAKNTQGVIIYDTDQSANRTAIETALNNFLEIY